VAAAVVVVVVVEEEDYLLSFLYLKSMIYVDVDYLLKHLEKN
jgi:hypothetical protein